MGTRFEKDAKHLECRVARTVEKERRAKAKALFCTTSVSGKANYPSALLVLCQSCFAGGAEMTCGLIPGHDGVAHIPQPQNTKIIYLARWGLILTQIL